MSSKRKRKSGRRGILGLPSSYSGNWSSDDSDDSDYKPGLETTEKATNTLKKARIKESKLKPREKSKRPGKKSVQFDDAISFIERNAGNGNDECGHEISHMPTELLTIIFKNITSEQGSVPFISRASQVCMKWQEIAINPYFWEHVDLSFGYIKKTMKTLNWLCEERLSKVKILDLTGWKELTNLGIQAIVRNCPLLESINISMCAKLSEKDIFFLLENCKNIHSFIATNMPIKITTGSSLCKIAQIMGANLRLLDVSQNHVLHQTVLPALSKNCPNLENLNISQMKFVQNSGQYSIAEFQRGCPNIRVLKMSNYCGPLAEAIKDIKSCPGFPFLREFDCGNVFEGPGTTGGVYVLPGIHNGMLSSCTHGATQLKHLNIRWSSLITMHTVAGIPALGLQRLDMQGVGHGTLHSQNLGGFHHICQKWGHSLRELDISWVVLEPTEIHDGLLAISTTADNKLGALALAGTKVSAETVREVLKNCTNLHYLNISSCRQLERGTKRIYDSKEDLKVLKTKMNIDF